MPRQKRQRPPYLIPLGIDGWALSFGSMAEAIEKARALSMTEGWPAQIIDRATAKPVACYVAGEAVNG